MGTLQLCLNMPQWRRCGALARNIDTAHETADVSSKRNHHDGQDLQGQVVT